MKLLKIIYKNLKVLLRSKSSALVIILGPLLLILLVGLAFSNSSEFTLNIGVYSPDYNNLTTSYIEKLGKDNYRIIEFSSQEQCIGEIKGSNVHTCIIFPEDFELANNKSNEIKFYIDQTRQNFVYAVIDTLSSSFVSRSSELSLDLTTGLVDVISRTQSIVLEKKEDGLSKAIQLNKDVQSTSKSLQSKLSSNQVDTGGVKSVSGDLDKEAKVLKNRISDIYGEGKNLLNLSYGIVQDSDTVFNHENKSQDYWEDKLRIYKGEDGSLFQAWNDSIIARENFINKTTSLTSSVISLVDAIGESEEKQNEVIAELRNGLDEDVKDIEDELEGVDEGMDEILRDISGIAISSAQSIVSPITTSIETVIPEKSQLDYLFPSLVVLLIMFMSILLASTLILMEKNSKAYFRNFITPTSDIVFVLSTFLTSMLLMFFQIMVVLIIAGAIFKTSIFNNFLNVTILVLMISSVFVLIGMAIGYLFNTEETAMIGAISVGSIILFTSDIIVPIENMPLSVQNFAKFSPFIVGANALKKLMLFTANLSQIKEELIFLGVTITIIAALIIFIQQIMKMHFINRFSRAKKAKAFERPENIIDIFKIDDHLIRNDNELYRFIKRLPRRDFKKLIYKKSNRIADFALEILKEEELAKKLSRMRTRWGNLKVLEKFGLQKTSKGYVSQEQKSVTKPSINEQNKYFQQPKVPIPVKNGQKPKIGTKNIAKKK